MINNPYEILGVSQNASNDEIKKAYHELSKKYHPDSYADNPLSELAEEKFKEIQEAYQMIMDQREGSFRGGFGGQSNSSYDAGGSYGGQENEQDAMRLNAVANYLNARRYQEALNALDGIASRPARWFYYAAVANAGMGNNIAAMEQARRANAMEPGNREYINFLNQLQWSGQRYQTRGYGNSGGGYDMANCCCDLWCADSLCECMGGDLISCC